MFYIITDAFVECVARICHEANRAYCVILGDSTQPPWEWAPQWQRDSACAGVRFRFEHPFDPASASHEQWLAHKQAEGWIYGSKKDPEAKTHPCMVPFDELPEEQRVKDELFAAICRTVQLGLLQPGPLQDHCKNRSYASVGTMYECGLPAGHAGVCMPQGALPVPEAKPKYIPGDDE
jgi:hypothetical protein